MRIALGVDVYRQGDGISRVVETSAEELSKRGYEVAVICGRTDKQQTGAVIESGYSEGFAQVDIRRAVRTVMNYRPDCFYSHYYPMDIVGSMVQSKGIPHLMHWHGIANLALRETVTSAMGWARASVGAFMGCHGCARILSISQYATTCLQRRFHPQAAKIVTIGNPINVEKFSPAPTSRVSNDHPLVLTIGGITPIKGQLKIVKAAEILKQNGMDFRVIIAGAVKSGSRSYMETIRSYIRRADLDGCVTISGQIGESELIKLYRSCDVFAYGSSWESFGLPVAEAMSCGKPVVCFGTGSLPELVEDGKTGFLVEYDNLRLFSERIQTLLTEPETCRRMGERGREEMCRRFSTDVYMSRLTDCLESSTR